MLYYVRVREIQDIKYYLHDGEIKMNVYQDNGFLSLVNSIAHITCVHVDLTIEQLKFIVLCAVYNNIVLCLKQIIMYDNTRQSEWVALMSKPWRK